MLYVAYTMSHSYTVAVHSTMSTADEEAWFSNDSMCCRDLVAGIIASGTASQAKGTLLTICGTAISRHTLSVGKAESLMHCHACMAAYSLLSAPFPTYMLCHSVTKCVCMLMGCASQPVVGSAGICILRF